MASSLYVTDNKEGAKKLFEGKMLYKVRLDMSPHKNIVDFNFGEKFLYGRVDRAFTPMVYNRAGGLVKITRFPNSVPKEAGWGALNFVVDAFRDLSQQFDKCRLLGKIDTTDPYLSTLNVYKAYQNPTKLYYDNKTVYYKAIKTVFRKKKTKFKNFDEFIKELMGTLEAIAHRNPMTKPGFIKSRRCPINCSGLVVEIAALDPVNDSEKIRQFVNSNNWEFYVAACASYGFMIDQAVPWRLVADIGDSPERSPILEYAKRYGVNSPDEIIETTYKNAYYGYYIDFKNELLFLYNSLKVPSYSVLEECGARTITKMIVPASYSPVTLNQWWTEEEFLKIYFKIRFLEEESVFTDMEKDSMIEECIELYEGDDLGAALRSFEGMLNKTFDYRGSVSYIKEHLEAVEDAEFQEAGSDPYGY